jgi:hypothetical protein
MRLSLSTNDLMNTQLVKILAQIIKTLSKEEQILYQFYLGFAE